MHIIYAIDGEHRFENAYIPTHIWMFYGIQYLIEEYQKFEDLTTKYQNPEEDYCDLC